MLTLDISLLATEAHYDWLLTSILCIMVGFINVNVLILYYIRNIVFIVIFGFHSRCSLLKEQLDLRNESFIYSTG